jgi:uncharacterized protein (DUF1800 family)
MQQVRIATAAFVVLLAVVATSRPTPAIGLSRAQARGVPSDPAAVEHALNRLTFGPRAGDVERVQKIGLGTWIDRQLSPSSIDDSALTSRLPALPDKPDIDSPQEARRYGREAVQVLAAAKMMRAVHSDRQLEEVLVDFWFNHFNVFAGKGRTSLFIPDYEREAIRPHVLGRFRDLLGATAKSPAMLFYLDNWLSADPEAAERLATQREQRRTARGLDPNAQARRRGLNENYGRELLELHTLGVDGGYTQQDVIEVARAFTGWTIGPPEPAGGRRGLARRRARAGAQAAPAMDADPGDAQFRFMTALHDSGEKVVLGQRIKSGGGIEDGERVLDIVAAHPATARHIATKLARRFVSDDPPSALVDRVAARFRETNGNLREVVRAVVTSPEFFAAGARRAKMKTPLEFVTSAVRLTGRDVTDARPMLRALQQLGMAPYMCQPPTGYDDTAETWITAGALVTRMNVAQQIAGAEGATVIGGPEFQKR